MNQRQTLLSNMKSRALCLLVLHCFINVCDFHPLIRPRNGLRECRKNSSLTALEVLPGGGWDNLRNIDMGRVMNLSYSQCQTTEDGAYLIPDEVFVVPQKISGVETNSEMIMSWLEQKSSTSSSINADVSFYSVVNAKFSTENQRMKTHQVKDNSVTARVQVRNHLYSVKAYPDFTLDSRFAHQAEEIADAVENNQTRQATYLSEKLILDYGTHVITSVDAGATLLQEDYLKMSYVSNSQSDMTSISASAGFNFFDKVKFDIGGKDSHGSSETSCYQGNITYSIVQSHGGALFYPGITLQKWQESTLNNLVAIDRSGLPLHYFLNPTTFPDLPVPTVNKIALSVKHAIESYYKVNTIPGCVNPDSKNFNFQANVDDASCEGPVTNLTFGGVYQTCNPLTSDGNVLCDELAQKNPATGDFSCPQVYTATLLRSETEERGYNKYECHRHCHSCGFLWLDTCCDQTCGDAYRVSSAKIDTYWCSTSQKTPENSGYLFGGLYGPSLQNPITKSRGCPPNFFTQRFLSNGMMVCLSNDYETGTRFSVPFGGFFSCQSSNPLANDQSRCPTQFSQHLAAISDGCQILFCVQSGVFTGGQLKPVRLPPFSRPPLVSMMATNTIAVMTEGDRSWVRVERTKMWRLAKPGEIKQMASMFDAPSQMSGGEKAGLAVGLIALIALFAAGTVILVKRRRFSGLGVSRGYEELHSQSHSESGVENQREQQMGTANENPIQPI
ncbi:LOW QUALITY PROTEIN: macrophage expressed 1, tandem duplicate 1 [Triplophysa dalaica]|uniref:LOW QUALITY PROTEIN: macrophage expressed 1, tandem duplicate 1 n=1 Tax=Triplophysa dalaica TaxID=1582913 RepID=UPI0024DFCAA4|nr:LOW QUALITY PROTEIN: macrophage expressed 1, tandem duplicate 1 [Triplophysa dalaica]